MHPPYFWSILEEEMATHFSILACKIPWTEKPGGLQSMESQNVRLNWATEYTPMVHVLFQCGVFELFFRWNESAGKPFKSVFFVPNFYSFPGNIPQWFSNASIFGLSFPCKTEELGCLMWSSNLLLLRENSYIFVILPSCRSLQLGCVFCFGFVFFFLLELTSLSFFYLPPGCLLTLCCERLIIKFSDPFQREVFHMQL